MSQKFNRNTHVVRVLTVLAFLRARKMSIGQLARELAVSTRTIRRDLEALEMAYVPIVDEEHGPYHAKVWTVIDGWQPDIRRMTGTSEVSR